MRAGRLPDAARPDEVAVDERFADAHGYTPGDRFTAVIDGKRRTLAISGVVLSPEFVYTIGPGDMMPDPRRFGVLFVPRPTLEALLDMTGALDDVTLTTPRGADETAIIDALDRILAPYGGSGAYPRAEQTSAAFVDGELTQLAALAAVIPPVFLFVAAVLVNMILSRLIALEREQIGLLKAIGYGSGAIGWHYAKLVASIAPAVAMQPPAPPSYRGRVATDTTAAPDPRLSRLDLMALRDLVRWPLRSALTVLGTALSVALLVVALFT